MSRRLLLIVVTAVVLAVSVGYATATFLSSSDSNDVHTMSDGETMSGMMDVSP